MINANKIRFILWIIAQALSGGAAKEQHLKTNRLHNFNFARFNLAKLQNNNTHDKDTQTKDSATDSAIVKSITKPLKDTSALQSIITPRLARSSDTPSFITTIQNSTAPQDSSTTSLPEVLSNTDSKKSDKQDEPIASTLPVKSQPNNLLVIIAMVLIAITAVGLAAARLLKKTK